MSFFSTAINFLALPFKTSSYRNDLRRTLLALSVVGVLALLGLVSAMLVTVLPNLPAFDVVTDYRPKIPLRIYTADGALHGEFGDEHRDFTPIKEIPPVLKDALLAIEDARFYEHSGVDYRGGARALVADLTSGFRQGASTITMQLARNFYLSTEKTFTRKIYEILLALQIELRLDRFWGGTPVAAVLFGALEQRIAVDVEVQRPGVPIAGKCAGDGTQRHVRVRVCVIFGTGADQVQGYVPPPA